MKAHASVIAMLLLALCVHGCDDDAAKLAEPTLNQSSASGVIGWEGSPPAPNQETTGCQSDEDCDGQPCQDGQCGAAMCLASGDCNDDPQKPICDPETRRCVPCSTDDECADLGRYCAPESGRCVDCRGHQDCPEEAHCAENVCVEDVCSAGESYCEDGGVRECSASGENLTEPVPCGPKQVCQQIGDSAECVNQVCAPGASYCEEQNAITCADDGLSSEEQDCAASDQVCVDGVCQATSECSADDECPLGERCDNGECRSCEPGECDTCDVAGFTAADEQLGKVNGNILVYQALTEANPKTSRLQIEIYEGWTGAAIQPGLYDLTGINYSACANCVLIHDGCDDEGCERSFYATEGMLVIDTYGSGQGFVGRLKNLVLRESTINPETYESEAVSEGATWCISDYVFDLPWGTPNPDDPGGPNGPNVPPTVEASLVALWPLDGNGLDISGHDRHGVLEQATATSDRFGNPEGALSITPGGSVTIGYDADFDFDGAHAFTVSAWIAPDAPVCVDNPIATKYDYFGNAGWMLSHTDYGAGGHLMLTLGKHSCLASSLPGSLEAHTGWHHVAGVYDPEGVMRLYIDGAEVSDYWTQDASCSVWQPTGFSMRLGTRGDDSCPRYSGGMDDVRVYRRALSSVEISAISQSP